MLEGYFPIKKIVCEGGYACFSGKKIWSHVCLPHVLFICGCLQACTICLSWCQFSIQQLHLTIDLFETIEIRGVVMHGFKVMSTI
jgi:hypothetical protein